MAKEVKSDRLDKINAELKEQRAGVTIQQLGDRLYLRGTFPPKPGSRQTIAYSQRISLGVYANPAGFKRAKAEALRISSDLALNRFDWEVYLRTSEKEQVRTVKDWLKAFEKQYFEERAKTGKTETTWLKDYLVPFRRLDPGTPLTAELMVRAIATTSPDTRARQRTCMAFGALAKFAGIELDTSKLKGSYSPKAVQPRDLPSDELIAEWRDKIPDPAWQWFYGVLATYGVRNHEAFLIDPVSIQTPPGIITVLDGKTGSRRVWHCSPIDHDWWQEWELFNVQIPDVTATRHSDYGLRSSQYFKRLGLPFKLYCLRHCWAVRTAVRGLNDSIAAKMQGHSLQVHTSVYQNFINDSHFQAAWEAMHRKDKDD